MQHLTGEGWTPEPTQLCLDYCLMSQSRKQGLVIDWASSPALVMNGWAESKACDSELGSKPGDRQGGCTVYFKLQNFSKVVCYCKSDLSSPLRRTPPPELIRAIFGETMNFDKLYCAVRVDEISSKWTGLSLLSTDELICYTKYLY